MKCFQKNKAQKGFTLVELAIVLTIVAILIAAVVQGDRLISSFRIASTVSYFEKYKNAYQEFQKKYMALPGDMDDASTAISGAVLATASLRGDNKIDFTSNNTEQFAAWQQMSVAQLIQGGYSGTGTQTTYSIGSTANIPSGPHQQSGFRIYYNATYLSHEISYTRFQTGCTNAAKCEFLGILLPSDAILIDMKMDDAVPNAGAIISENGNSLNSADVLTALNCASGANYTLATNEKACLVHYLLDK